MNEKKYTRIKNRIDTEANWQTNDPVLYAGEIAITSDKNNIFKIGDGTSTWSTLPYNIEIDNDFNLIIGQGNNVKGGGNVIIGQDNYTYGQSGNNAISWTKSYDSIFIGDGIGYNNDISSASSGSIFIGTNSTSVDSDAGVGGLNIHGTNITTPDPDNNNRQYLDDVGKLGNLSGHTLFANSTNIVDALNKINAGSMWMSGQRSNYTMILGEDQNSSLYAAGHPIQVDPEGKLRLSPATTGEANLVYSTDIITRNSGRAIVDKNFNDFFLYDLERVSEIKIGTLATGSSSSNINIGFNITNNITDSYNIALGNDVEIGDDTEESIAIGNRAIVSGTGAMHSISSIAIGQNAEVYDASNAVQLGNGTNIKPSTLQFMDYTIAYNGYLKDVGELIELDTKDRATIVRAINEVVDTKVEFTDLAKPNKTGVVKTVYWQNAPTNGIYSLESPQCTGIYLDDIFGSGEMDTLCSYPTNTIDILNRRKENNYSPINAPMLDYAVYAALTNKYSDDITDADSAYVAPVYTDEDKEAIREKFGIGNGGEELITIEERNVEFPSDLAEDPYLGKIDDFYVYQGLHKIYYKKLKDTTFQEINVGNLFSTSEILLEDMAISFNGTKLVGITCSANYNTIWTYSIEKTSDGLNFYYDTSDYDLNFDTNNSFLTNKDNNTYLYSILGFARDNSGVYLSYSIQKNPTSSPSQLGVVYLPLYSTEIQNAITWTPESAIVKVMDNNTNYYQMPIGLPQWINPNNYDYDILYTEANYESTKSFCIYGRNVDSEASLGYTSVQLFNNAYSIYDIQRCISFDGNRIVYYYAYSSGRGYYIANYNDFSSASTAKELMSITLQRDNVINSWQIYPIQNTTKYFYSTALFNKYSLVDTTNSDYTTQSALLGGEISDSWCQEENGIDFIYIKHPSGKCTKFKVNN